LSQSLVLAGLLLASGLVPTTAVVGAAPLGLVAVGPAARPPAEIVLTPADLGPDFVVASSGQTTILERGSFGQSIRRGNLLASSLVPEGIVGVRTVALVLPDVPTSDRAFQDIATQILEGFQEAPLPALAERARGGIAWGQRPFEPASILVIFRTGTTVGFVATFAFDAPTSMDDTVRLAQIMIARARG